MSFDDVQQIIRKMGDVIAGSLLTYGVATADNVYMWAGAITGVLSLGWWYIWNRTRPAADGTPPAAA
jgi:hypothetical protein